MIVLIYEENQTPKAYAVKQHRLYVNCEIIQLCEMNGKNERVNLTLYGRKITADICHNQIKTYGDDGREVDAVELSSKAHMLRK